MDLQSSFEIDLMTLELSINLKYEYATQHTKKEKHKCRDKESATFIKLICLKYHFYKSPC